METNTKYEMMCVKSRFIWRIQWNCRERENILQLKPQPNIIECCAHSLSVSVPEDTHTHTYTTVFAHFIHNIVGLVSEQFQQV